MKRKVLFGTLCMILSLTALITFESFSKEIENAEPEITEVRWRRDRYVEGHGLMQCVSLSLRKCEYVWNLHEIVEEEN